MFRALRRPLCRRCAGDPACRCGAARADAASRSPPRARRQDGALRRLRNAGSLSDRHPCRAPPYAEPGWSFRRLPYGPDPAFRGALHRRPGGAGSGRSPSAGADADALHAVPERSRRHPRRPDGDAAGGRAPPRRQCGAQRGRLRASARASWRRDGRRAARRSRAVGTAGTRCGRRAVPLHRGHRPDSPL